jgi:hypothetical protein
LSFLSKKVILTNMAACASRRDDQTSMLALFIATEHVRCSVAHFPMHLSGICQRR